MILNNEFNELKRILFALRAGSQFIATYHLRVNLFNSLLNQKLRVRCDLQQRI